MRSIAQAAARVDLESGVNFDFASRFKTVSGNVSGPCPRAVATSSALTMAAIESSRFTTASGLAITTCWSELLTVSPRSSEFRPETQSIASSFSNVPARHVPNRFSLCDSAAPHRSIHKLDLHFRPVRQILDAFVEITGERQMLLRADGHAIVAFPIAAHDGQRHKAETLTGREIATDLTESIDGGGEEPVGQFLAIAQLRFKFRRRDGDWSHISSACIQPQNLSGDVMEKHITRSREKQRSTILSNQPSPLREKRIDLLGGQIRQ